MNIKLIPTNEVKKTGSLIIPIFEDIPISKLPEKQRLVFNMKYFDKMKYKEISEILNTSVGSLKASYHLAVHKIKKNLYE